MSYRDVQSDINQGIAAATNPVSFVANYLGGALISSIFGESEQERSSRLFQEAATRQFNARSAWWQAFRKKYGDRVYRIALARAHANSMRKYLRNRQM